MTRGMRPGFAPVGRIASEGLEAEVAVSETTERDAEGVAFRRVRATMGGVPFHGVGRAEGGRLAFEVRALAAGPSPDDAYPTAVTVRGSVRVGRDLGPMPGTLSGSVDATPVDLARAAAGAARHARDGAATREREARAWAGFMGHHDRRVGPPPPPRRSFADGDQQRAWDAMPSRFRDAAHARSVKAEVNRLLLAGAGTGGPHVALLQELNARIDDLTAGLRTGSSR